MTVTNIIALCISIVVTIILLPFIVSVASELAMFVLEVQANVINCIIESWKELLDKWFK